MRRLKPVMTGKSPSQSPVVVVLFRALSNKSNKWLELTAKYVKAENLIKTWTSDASRSIATLRALQQPSLLASLADDWTPATSKSRWYCFILLYIIYLPLLQACIPCGSGMIYLYIIWYDTMYSCRDMFYDLSSRWAQNQVIFLLEGNLLIFHKPSWSKLCWQVDQGTVNSEGTAWFVDIIRLCW